MLLSKQNLYKQLKLKENQAPTNFTLDFVRVGVFTGEFLVLRQLKAVITADVFEFSNNGEYTETQITETKPKLINDFPKKQVNSS